MDAVGAWHFTRKRRTATLRRRRARVTPLLRLGGAMICGQGNTVALAHQLLGCRWLATPIWASLVLAIAGCGPSSSAATLAADTATDAVAADIAPTADTTAFDQSGPAGTTQPDLPAPDATAPLLCDDGLPPAEWAKGPYGLHRHDLADDFEVALQDGQTWPLAAQYTGCDVYAFVPDSIPVSDLDSQSIWTKDVAALLKKSPKNVHWFFFSRAPTDAAAKVSLQAMQARIADALGTLPEADGQWWWQRTHVIATRAAKMPGWLGKVSQGHGKLGFGIDRNQRIAGFGLLADVDRFKPALQAAKKWPWEANLAYAAHEPLAWNAQAKAQALWASHPGSTVTLWKGETLAQFAETDVTLTTAQELEKFDTLQIEIEMRCPDAEQVEPGNCGAWDYLAALSIMGADGKWVEMARFITSYHRETHWRVDATPMLAELAKGGQRRFKWEYAPEWNKQPTATWLSLKFSNLGKAVRPVATQLLWTGGPFNSKYDTLHPDQAVAIAKDTKKVELWAMITGHGSAKDTQCAEFCNHEHKFTVGGKAWTKTHPEIGNNKGCVAHIVDGMVPNQGGTWWFGRGGWCPGMQVEPFVVDLTAQTKAGQTTIISYNGLFVGKPPPDGDATIQGAVYLVQYR